MDITTNKRVELDEMKQICIISARLIKLLIKKGIINKTDLENESITITNGVVE